MVLICISFTDKGDEHFFICFLAMWTLSFEKPLFSSFAYYFIGSFIYWEVSFLLILQCLESKPGP
jgi:hypothetical protein